MLNPISYLISDFKKDTCVIQIMWDSLKRNLHLKGTVTANMYFVHIVKVMILVNLANLCYTSYITNINIHANYQGRSKFLNMCPIQISLFAIKICSKQNYQASLFYDFEGRLLIMVWNYILGTNKASAYVFVYFLSLNFNFKSLTNIEFLSNGFFILLV